MHCSKRLVLLLLAYLAHTAPRSVLAHSKESGTSSIQVSWTRPSSGDIYGPGGTISGEWESKQDVVSPSIRLCALDRDSDDRVERSCGETVWPEIKKVGRASSFSLIVPDIKSASKFYLEMKDDFGRTTTSPTFSLDPSVGAKNGGPSAAPKGTGNSGTSEGNQDVSGHSGPGATSNSNNGDSHQVPFNGPSAGGNSQSHATSPNSSSKKPNTSSGSDPQAVSGGSQAPAKSSGSAPHRSQVTKNASASGPISSASSSLPAGVNVDSLTPQEAVLSRAALPTAAIAVPLSLLGATILASLGLCIAHRRSLAAQRTKNAQLIDVRRNASVRTSESKAPFVERCASRLTLIDDPDIEKAISALSGCDSKSTSRHGSMRREDSVVYVPVSARYAVPRQDVRRQRTNTYERSYEWPYNTDSDHFVRRHPSQWSGYQPSYLRSPPREYLRPLSRHHRWSRHRRRRRSDRHDDDEDGASSTEAILSGYISPCIPPSRLPRFDPYFSALQEPPRSHSRQTAPLMAGYRHHHRTDDGYGATSSPHARSFRSF